MDADVLITGFEPFGPHAVNPSQLLIERLSARRPPRVTTALLPVGFEAGPRLVRVLIERIRPRAVLCVGLAASRRPLCVERVAVNERTGTDNDGLSCDHEPVDPSGPDGLFASIDWRALLAGLRSAGFEAEESWSAGTFVCNSVFYAALTAARAHGGAAGFLHIPADTDTVRLAEALDAWAEGTGRA
ncbi:putative pyroglutamyl-peptidase I [Schaalia georgiae F0490]|uniref:Pyrrolidone-carboxylate peptidase n=1 Tax=Schaalia georgiae F0490 TaxID=1125717 RepID=J0MY43_9ACTO|nr:pyroglutamyl-peptidase I [Schaalia georgiae]EJF39324.1 putative pyroglutamyl-peptidase I [Schaalia georgiae F0490]